MVVLLSCFIVELFPVFIMHIFFHSLNYLQSHASQILGFKFQYYQRLEVNDPVPSGLYQLTALLVKRDFIDVDSM